MKMAVGIQSEIWSRVSGKDLICGINELGQLPLSEHKHLLDCMEGNGFRIVNNGFPIFIETYRLIIALVNPINNKWGRLSNIDNSEFPT